MKRWIYKLTFSSGVHFGVRNLTETESFFCADTLFSALCLEALEEGEDVLASLYSKVKSGDILFSDGMPYIGSCLYVPKPFISLKRERRDSDSKGKKTMKRLKFLPARSIDDFFNDTLDVEQTAADLKKLGIAEERTCAAVHGLEETMPWRVGVYRFNEGSGLYLCVILGSEEEEMFFDRLLTGLSYTGIGGERSSGYGRFCYTKEEMPEYLEKRFSDGYEHYMTLSVSMGNEEELDGVMENASFLLKKRSGFTDSRTPGEGGFRKKDLYVFSSGACFEQRFQGDVFDVSRKGLHPVYRYAKAMMIGV